MLYAWELKSNITQARAGFVAAKSETKAEGFAARSWWTEEMQREVRSDNRYC